MYYVVEGKNIGTMGNPEIQENIVFSSEDEKTAANFESNLRKKYKDRTVVDCWITSDEEKEKTSAARKFYDSLTDDQKKEIIEVDGKRYIKAIY